MPEDKKPTLPTGRQVVVSGVQPSGDIHIGNYLGAIKQFVKSQDKYKSFFFIADLHALTLRPQDPEKLRKQNEKIFKTKYWKRWRILYSIKIVSREFYSNNNIGQSGKI